MEILQCAAYYVSVTYTLHVYYVLIMNCMNT